MIVEIIITIIGLFAIFRSLFMLRKRKISIFLCIFWIVLWLTAIIAVAVPQVSSAITDFFGRDISMVLFFNILILYYFSLMLYLKINKNEEKITKLVREMALRDREKKNF